MEETDFYYRIINKNILPLTSIKDNEVYAPNYKNGITLLRGAYGSQVPMGMVGVM